MKKLSERDGLKAEIESMKKLLEHIPGENILSRFPIETRIESLEEELVNLPEEVPTAEPAGTVIKFNGEPVIEQRGITPSFSKNQMHTIDSLVRISNLRLNDDTFSRTGAIPGGEKLMITGVAHGSFGFVLEEIAPPPQTDLELGDRHSLQEAIDETLKLIEEAKSRDDLGDFVDEIGERSYSLLRDLINGLSSNKATISLSTPTHKTEMNMDDIARVKDKMERLDEKPKETEPLLLLECIVLPKTRKADYRLPGEDEYRSCKVSKDIPPEDIVDVNAGKSVRAVFLEKEKSRGKGTERTLISFIFE